MKTNPKVSVIMPAYNAANYIGAAIESILNQTFKDFELIIINDCSTDNTKSIIKKYGLKDSRIKLINNNENLKIARTLNKGLASSKGKYIVRMDADDWSYPERIERQIKLMDSNPDIVISSGNMEICDEVMTVKNRSNFPLTNNEIREVLLQYNPLVSPAMIWRREISSEIGGFSVNTMSEDYMFLMDMSSKGELANLPDILLKYRVLPTSTSSLRMTEAHLSTIQIAITGHLRYNYPMTTKTKLIILSRFIISYCIPPNIWRFISTVLR